MKTSQYNSNTPENQYYLLEELVELCMHLIL